MRLGLPHHALGIATLSVVALVTLPGAIGLFGEVYRVDGGAASAAAASSSTPTRTPDRAIVRATQPVATSTLELLLTAPSSTPTIEGTPTASTPTAASTKTVSIATSTPEPAQPTTPSTRTPTGFDAPSSTPVPSTPRAAFTIVPTATATATVLPTATSTPDPCLTTDALIVFPTAELHLRTTSGRGATKLAIENRGKRPARDVRLTLTAVQGRDRLIALSIGDTKGDLTSEKQLSFSIPELAAGATTAIELRFELDLNSGNADAVTKTAPTSLVELELEVVGEACPRLSKEELPTMRVLIESEPKTIAPGSPAPATVVPATNDSKPRSLVADSADASKPQ